MIDQQYWMKLPINVREHLIKKYNLTARNEQNIDKLNEEIRDLVENKKVKTINRPQMHILKSGKEDDNEVEEYVNDPDNYEVFTHEIKTMDTHTNTSVNNKLLNNNKDYQFNNVQVSIEFAVVYIEKCDIIDNNDIIVVIYPLDKSTLFLTIEPGKMAKISYEDNNINCIYLTNFKYNDLAFWVFFKRPDIDKET